MSFKDYFGYLFLCAGAGFVGGGGMGDYLAAPKAIYLRDVNDDQKEDCIIETNGGGRTIFLYDNGKFTKLDKVMERLRQESEGGTEKIDELEKLIRKRAREQ